MAELTRLERIICIMEDETMIKAKLLELALDPAVEPVERHTRAAALQISLRGLLLRRVQLMEDELFSEKRSA